MGDDGESPRKAVCCVLVGMAGSGKTTLLQRLVADMHQRGKRSYVINLDPAVRKLPYGCHIDIRQTVKYKEVMKQYELGPNGGIMTSLNLFATKFDQVLSFVEKRVSSVDYVFVDTPGQIEAWTWSASGTIFTESLAAIMPTCLIYVVDTPRSSSATTFMSSMLYACSIVYKYRLPLMIAFNKVDVVGHEFAMEWMKDFQKFQDAVVDTGSYMDSLTSSMGLVLDEFYSKLDAIGVSAMTGEGMNDFVKAVDRAVEQYEQGYKVEIDAKVKERRKKEREQAKTSMQRLAEDGLMVGNDEAGSPWDAPEDEEGVAQVESEGEEGE